MAKASPRSEPIDFWFSIGSMYTFLTVMRIDRVEDMTGIRSASEPFARLLARRVRENLGATWGLSETGASGPTGTRYGDAPGHACIAVSGPVEAVITLETRSADREANMWAFTRKALELMESCLRRN